jgi:hypothetical protein
MLAGMRSAPFRAAVAACAVLAIPALALGGCSSDSKKKTTPTDASTTAAAKTDATFKITTATVDAPGNPVAFPAAANTAIAAALKTWATDAVLTPLETGKAGPAAIFSPAASTHVAVANDHGTLFESLRAQGTVKITAASASLVGLADTNGAIGLITAHYTFDVQTKTADGAITISHGGDFVFAPQGSTWQVAYYDAIVLRSGPGAGPNAGTSQASTTKGKA